MQLIFVFAIVFMQVFIIHFGKIVEIIRAFGIHAFMNAEKLAVFLGSKGTAAVGAEQPERRGNKFTGAEGLAADFALVLAISPIIIIDEMVWSAT